MAVEREGGLRLGMLGRLGMAPQPMSRESIEKAPRTRGADKVVAVERYGGRATLSGVETDQTEAEVYTLRDGKILRVVEYAHRDEALEAAGLSE